jgi:hypothetical protein
VDLLWSILYPHEINGELNSHHLQSTWGCKAYIRQGAARCPEGIVCDAAITTSVPCNRRHDDSTLAYQSPVCRFRTPNSPWRGRLELDFGEVVGPKIYVAYTFVVIIVLAWTVFPFLIKNVAFLWKK